VFGFLTRSIPRRILAALVAVYCVTYGATAVVVYSSVRASIIDSNRATLDQVADLKYEKLANVVDALATDLAAWSDLDVMNDLISGDIDKRVTQTLESLKRLYAIPGEIYAFDARGKLLASSNAPTAGNPIALLPAPWHTADRGVAFIDKEKDPVTGADGVALATPVYGSFDKTYRIGTLVITYPWPSIEQMIFSLDTETVLLERSEPSKVLAANPPDIAVRAGLGGVTSSDANAGFVVGHSVPRSGLIGRWQLVALQPSSVAIEPLRRVAAELGLLGIGLAGPIIFLGRWLSQRLTAPIHALIRVAGEIADTDKLDARVPVTSSDELGALAQSFNRMTANLERTTEEREQSARALEALNQSLEAKIAARTAQLEEAIDAQRRLLADISHEIKSPLARLSMALGLARRSPGSGAAKQFDRIEKEIDTISALAGELLTLARLDASIAVPEFAPVELSSLIEQIVADAIYEHPARKPDITVRKTAAAPLTIVGNADLLRRAIENVVRNAIFYTAEGTGVEIALAQRGTALVSITIADQGPGVPASALEHLFEPFYRVDEARARDTGGAGIGLAICARVVKLHRGTVAARNAMPHGLIVDIDLPGGSTPR
jgi:signal transduction histidine kinase